MQQKPALWNVSPALIAPEARGLWKDVAFIAPHWPTLGKAVLLNSRGAPYLSSPTPTLTGTVWKASPYGISLGGNSSDYRRILYTGFPVLVTSNGSGGGDFSLLQLANPAGTNAASQPNVGVLQRRSSNPFPQAGLIYNGSQDFGYSAGMFGFFTYNNGDSKVSSNSMVDGKWHLFGGVRRAGSMYAWRDGVIVASGSPTLRDIYNSASDFCIGASPHNSNRGLQNSDDIALTIGWNRALTDAEMRLLARDPFIMIRPYAEWRGVWTPIAAGIESIGNAFAGAAAFAQHATMRFSSVKAFGGSSAQGLSKSGRKSTSAAASGAGSQADHATGRYASASSAAGAAAHGGAKTSRSASSSAIAGGSAFSASGIIGAIASAVAGAAAYAGSFTSRISSANAFAGARASSAAKTSRSAVAKVVAGARASAGGIASRIASAVAAAGAWARSVALPKIIAYAARIIVRDDARRIIVKDDARRIIVKDDARRIIVKDDIQ